MAFTMSFRDGHSLVKYLFPDYFSNFRPKWPDPLSFLSLVNLSYFCFSLKLTWITSAGSSYLCAVISMSTHPNLQTFPTLLGVPSAPVIAEKLPCYRSYGILQYLAYHKSLLWHQRVLRSTRRTISTPDNDQNNLISQQASTGMSERYSTR